MKFIEKHNKLLAVALCACTVGTAAQSVHAFETKPGWHGQGKDRYYIQASNRKEATGLTEVNDKLYYFDKDGDMQFGWQTVSNNTYYFTSDGTAATGKTAVSGTVYNFQKGGKLYKGWSNDGKYYDNNGFKKTNEWVEEDGVSYYVDENGTKKTGWQDINGQKFYFDQDGKKVTATSMDIDGTNYTFNEDGTLKTGWSDDSNNYFVDGVKQTGYQVIDDNAYFFNADGSKSINENNVGDGGYYTGANGEIYDTQADIERRAAEQAAAEKAAAEKAAAEKAAAEQAAAEKAAAEQAAAQQQAAQQQQQAAAQQQAAQQQQQQAAAQQQQQQAAQQQQQQQTTTTTNSSKSAAIAAAALAQVGRTQDCTMLVTNSLAAVGINFHDWPEGYLSLGATTSNPVPGDIIVYSGHVAVYIGNGQAVHGGWLGSQTVVASVSCDKALIAYVHIA